MICTTQPGCGGMAVVAGVRAEDAAIEMIIMDSAPANLVVFELVELCHDGDEQRGHQE